MDKTRFKSVDEFVSKLEEIIPAIELYFNPTPAFGKYKSIMSAEAVKHPAKFNTNLVEFLIKEYTKEGDIVLDCMAGTGVLGVIAALHGRNAIQVEIEPRFYEWMEQARKNVESLVTLKPKGKIINILGDARNLTQLIKQTDIVITSPPYSDSYLGGGDPERRRERLIKAGYNPKDYLGGRARNAILKHYDEVDTTINSPSPQNIANLPHGNIDAIITSPPYLKSAEQGAGINKQRPTDVKIGCSTINRIVTHPEAIDNTKEYGSVDAIITSPPYESALEDSDEDYKMLESNRLQPLSDEEIEALVKRLMKNGKPTYLSEMLKVYREMYKVLKPGGRAIIVIKPFIRNKKIIDLPYHTYLLMLRCGFILERLYKLRLKQQSFWRILYAKRHPNVPLINHEYVLIMLKPKLKPAE